MNFQEIKRELEALKAAGLETAYRPMGSGGLFQVKVLKTETRVQASYGTGKNNYALCVIFQN